MADSVPMHVFPTFLTPALRPWPWTTFFTCIRDDRQKITTKQVSTLHQLGYKLYEKQMVYLSDALYQASCCIIIEQ